MSATLHTAAQSRQPAPSAEPGQPAGSSQSAQPAANPEPASSDHLLAIVRGLITFGHRLVRALGSKPDAEFWDSFVNFFRNRNIGLIAARVIRGLRMAQALEQRVLRNARQIDNPRPYRYTPRPKAKPDPDAAESAQPRSAPAAPQDEDLLTHLPTVEELASQIRHRPIGAVLADICRDLGIRPGCPNWPQLCAAIARNRGNFLRFLEDVIPNPRPVLPPGTVFPQPQAIPAGPTQTGPTRTAPIPATGPP